MKGCRIVAEVLVRPTSCVFSRVVACDRDFCIARARKQLLNKIVERVFVYDDTVVGIALHGDYGVVLDTAAKTPNEILKGLQKEIKKGAGNDEIACTQDGSDGIRSLTCIILVFLPKHISQMYLSDNRLLTGILAPIHNHYQSKVYA